MVCATTESGMLNAADAACTAASCRLSASILIILIASILACNASCSPSARCFDATAGVAAAAADDDDDGSAAAAAGDGPPPAEDDDDDDADAADDDDDACLGMDDDDDDDDAWWCAGNAGPIPGAEGATDIGSDLDDACDCALE